MSDYYHHLLSSMAGAGRNSPQDSPSTPNHQTLLTATVGGGGGGRGGDSSSGLTGSYQGLGYFAGFPEPSMFNSTGNSTTSHPPRPPRNRRKSAQGGDNIKHRRTRSGCYTCRGRRVKCDETHPICDRCRKGQRECVYPSESNTTSSKSEAASKEAATSSSASLHNSPTSSYDDHDEANDDEHDFDAKLDVIPDEEEPDSVTVPARQFQILSAARRGSGALKVGRIKSSARQGSETPSLEGTKVSSPSTSVDTANAATPAMPGLSESTGPGNTERLEFAHLPQDIRFYLAYFCDKVTHYHYGVLTDPDGFFRHMLPAMAPENEALLYAMVGFAAYHCTLRNPQGRIHQFLKYYNQSVTILLGFIKRKEQYSPEILLAILQLAVIEEYFGDWTNLMGHQRAAYEILVQLYTPQTVVETPVGRAILSMLSRYDVFIGLMGGFPAVIPEVWTNCLVDYYRLRLSQDPENPAWKIEQCSAQLRQLSRDISLLMETHYRSDAAPHGFGAEHARLAQRLSAWREHWDAAMTDPECQVRELLGRPATQAEHESIMDVSTPQTLYQGALFPTALLSCEWLTVTILHESQTLAGPQQQSDGELLARTTERALAICRIVEEIDLWPSSPPGSLIATQACLAVAALFLPRDAHHQNWVRRKFALLESMGYLSPLGMRARMAELFDDPTCTRWWLPDDEGFTPVLQATRAFADERNATAAGAAAAENTRGIRHVFSQMDIGAGGAGSAAGKGKSTATPR